MPTASRWWELARRRRRLLLVILNVLASLPVVVALPYLLAIYFGGVALAYLALEPLLICFTAWLLIREKLTLVLFCQSLPYAAIGFVVAWNIPYPPAAMLIAIFVALLAILLIDRSASLARKRDVFIGASISMSALSLIIGLISGAPLFNQLIVTMGIGGFAVWLVPDLEDRAGNIRMATAAALLAAFAGFVIASHFDWPGLANPVPSTLSMGRSRIKTLNSYPLDTMSMGVANDRHGLWRIEASPGALAAVATQFGMSELHDPPARFWQMAPYYWPRKLPAGGRIFSTPSFPAVERGANGEHYVMLVDAHQGRAFVWFKLNARPSD